MAEYHGPDHYRTLGVGVRASAAEVRAAYLRLARVHHPDHHLDAPREVRAAHEQSMRDANAAWAVLGDPTRRARYDATQADEDEGPGGTAGGSSARERRWQEDERAKAAWRPFDEREVEPDPRLADDQVGSPAPRTTAGIALGLLALGIVVLAVAALTGVTSLAGTAVVLVVALGALVCIPPLRALSRSVRNDRR